MVKIFGLFKSGWFIALIGVLLLSLLVWFGGPYLGIAGKQPLTSAVARLLVIVVIVAIWAIWLQVLHLRSRRKAEQLSSDVAAVEAPPAQEPGSEERAQLQQRFEEAVKMLRKRRGRGNLYTLPWYVVIGPPGSGKSTLVRNSGLHFPLSGRFGKDAVRGIGGTRNCDWWFTDEAVFLDTAGRYTTQDSDRAADAGAWESFLRLLRRYRKRRPINGVVVAMSVSDLLTLDAEGLCDHVDAVRQRLDELGEQLRIRVPVYLVVTKCDLVAGFGEFFDDLDAKQRNQVWGMSFPVARTMDGSAAGAFAAEFDLLIDRLDSRVFDRMHAERDPMRRAATLSFPLQMASLRNLVQQFVEGVFSGEQYGTPPLLRGVYLTSGAQEGTPIDRMLGAVARTFGVAPAQAPTATASQRTFFVERLLKDVVFRESGFAGTDPALERRKMVLQAGAWLGVVVVTALLLAGLFTSYVRNRAYLADVEQAMAAYPVTEDVTGADSARIYFAQVLERLQGMDAVQQVARQYRDDVPWLMSFGLYQGDAVGSQVHAAYLRELGALLLPGVAMRFRQGLAANADKQQALYYYLKGYLMLGQPRHRDGDQLIALSNIEWRKIFPSNVVLQEVLAKHFAVLLGEPEKMRSIALDDALVARARNTLRTADLAALMYGNLKLEVSASDRPGLHLDKALGLLADVFHRASGTPLSKPVPALYTQPVFRQMVHQGIAATVRQFADDDWVFGGATMGAMERARMQRQVLALYERDYIRYWDQLLKDLALDKAGNLTDASAIAAKLAGPSSPLKALLQRLAANTSDMLRAPAESKGEEAADKARELAGRKARQRLTQNALARVLVGEGEAEPAQAKPGDAISAHFSQLNALTAGEAGAAPIDRTLTIIGQLSKTLLTMTDFSQAAGQPNAQLLLARQHVKALPSPVSDWLTPLVHKSEHYIGQGVTSALAQQFRQAVGDNCTAFTRGRFPFAPSSQKDIPLRDFAALFGYGGSFDSYFKQTLAKLVDTSGSRWSWKTGPGAVRGPAGLLTTMRLADDIKRMYFNAGGAMPQVDFSITRPQLGAGIGKLEIVVDGQTFSYQPGGTTRMAMQWPGPEPGHVSISAWGPSGNLLSTFRYRGDWAWFHALQAAQLQQVSQLRYLATFNFGGHVATVSILAGSLNNPFGSAAVARFSCRG